MKVLIADDDRVSLLFLRRTLVRVGHEVVEANNGREALEILESAEAPRLAVLDWMMPGIDGLELCRRLRNGRDSRYVYIILLTARSQKQDVAAGLEAGADDYLIKPCDPLELRWRVHAGERVLNLEGALEEGLRELRQALAHVRKLQGLLPICMFCKRIRDEADVWHRLESYIEEHSEAMFSHSLCRECWESHFSQLPGSERPTPTPGPPKIPGPSRGSKGP